MQVLELRLRASPTIKNADGVRLGLLVGKGLGMFRFWRIAGTGRTDNSLLLGVLHPRKWSNVLCSAIFHGHLGGFLIEISGESCRGVNRGRVS